MKVLHINCNYVGTSLHRTMISHLDEVGGINNTVFAPICDENEIQKFRPKNNEVVVKCFNKWDRISFYYKQKKIIRCAEETCNSSDRFDILHAYTLFTDGNCAYSLSKKYGIPYVVAIRDTDVNYFLKYRKYLRKLAVEIMKGASRIFFLSDPYRDYVINNIVMKPYQEEFLRKSIVVPNGIDDFWLDNIYWEKSLVETKKRIDNHEIKIICVARINNRKNIPTLQKAVHRLSEKGWKIRLEVIGNVENQTVFSGIVSDPYTTYTEPINKEKLIDHYRNADLFALVSHTETFGLVYAEAMTQSLPVIYTSGQGFDGQFTEGEIGYSASDVSVDDIVKKIEMICGDYISIAERCKTRVGKYRWDRICHMYKNIYNEILG